MVMPIITLILKGLARIGQNGRENAGRNLGIVCWFCTCLSQQRKKKKGCYGRTFFFFLPFVFFSLVRIAGGGISNVVWVFLFLKVV